MKRFQNCAKHFIFDTLSDKQKKAGLGLVSMIGNGKVPRSGYATEKGSMVTLESVDFLEFLYDGRTTANRH